MGDKRRGYNLPNALCIRGRTHKVIEYEGHCRITIQQWSGDPQRSWCEYWYWLRGRKNAEASDSRITWLVWCLNRKKLWFSKTKDQKQKLWSRMDKLKTLSWTINKGLNCREPTHVQNDVWVGKIIHKDQVMILGIRNFSNQRTQNDNDKGCQRRLLDI